jgi:branched-chain amino acid aminotransferase
LIPDRKVWFNGELIPWEKATVPILSHGLSRGSAIFEAFGVHEGPGGIFAFRMDEHMKRMQQSCHLLGMALGFSTEEIMQAVSETVKANRIRRGLIKIMAFWGQEAVIKLVLDSPLDIAVFAIPNSEDLGLDRAKPISACISKWKKIHPETVPVEAKACSNYLNGFLVRRDANLRGFDVGLTLGTDGFVAEGSIESIFLVKDRILLTPPSGRILNSITRLSILQSAPFVDIPIMEKAVKSEDLFEADELFTCHSGVKVSPIERFETRQLHAPGPISTKMMALMENITHFKDDRFKHWFQKVA